MTNYVYGGIETGGTKFVCAIGTTPDNLKKTQFTTAGPGESISKAVDFFRNNIRPEELRAVGIASFGPLDLDKKSPTYGYITTTPKDLWSNIDIAGGEKPHTNIPRGFL